MKNNIPQSFIGKQADDLGNLIYHQIKPIYESLGIIIPVKSCSIIHYLYQSQGASLADLAKQLKQSHQLVKQKLPRLLQLEVIDIVNDKNDKRRKVYHLTAKGLKQADLLQKTSLQGTYENLCNELQLDLNNVLNRAINCLQEKDLFSRFQEINEEKHES